MSGEAITRTHRASEADRSGAPALRVTNLSTSFRTAEGACIEAVRDVSFEIAPGQTLVLLGESGSGKSVTARSILRLHGRRTEVSGSVVIADESVLDLSARRMRSFRGARVALVPQDPTGALDPLRRVGHQLTEVLRAHGMCTTRTEARSRAISLFDQVGLPDPEAVFRAYPHELSGGMRQRVVIAMAVSCDPILLIADEPTTALDVTVQAQILALFADIRHRLSTALLMVTHDVLVAADIADVIAVMYAGRIVEVGPAHEVLESPRHPYTRALMGALPRPGLARGSLEAIPGSPPVAGTMHPGCSFADRCALAREACTQSRPVLIPISRSHQAAGPVLAPAKEEVS